MFAQEKLQELLNVTAITDLLNTFTVGTFTYPMLINANVLPDAWGPQKSTINYYHTSSIIGGDEYLDITYYINCRAKDEQSATEIAAAVYDVLNRISISKVGIVCTILPIITPADETDNYNAIVTAQIRTNGSVD